jgi:hypothetical protein
MRDEKTASRTFAQLKDRQEEFEQKGTSLREESEEYETKRSDVRMIVYSHAGRGLTASPHSWKKRLR